MIQQVEHNILTQFSIDFTFRQCLCVPIPIVITVFVYYIKYKTHYNSYNNNNIIRVGAVFVRVRDDQVSYHWFVVYVHAQ